MSMRLITIALASTAILAACATSQENPNYQYSTKYKGASPYGAQTQMASNTVTTQPVTYVQTQPAQPNQQVQAQTAVYQQTTSHAPAVQTHTQAQATYTQLDHRCLSRETNRQLIGGAVGGTIGAVIGKKVIGGTKGTVAGAALGGAAGYGIGDKSINCDPVQVAIPQQSVKVSPAYYPTTSGAAQPQVIYANTQSTAPTDAAMPSQITQSYGTPGYQAMLNAQNDDINAYAPAPAPAAQVVDVRSETTAPYSYSTALQGSHTGGQHQIVEGDTVYSLSRKLCTSIDEIKLMNSLGADFNIKIGDSISLPASRC